MFSLSPILILNFCRWRVTMPLSWEGCLSGQCLLFPLETTLRLSHMAQEVYGESQQAGVPPASLGKQTVSADSHSHFLSFEFNTTQADTASSLGRHSLSHCRVLTVCSLKWSPSGFCLLCEEQVSGAQWVGVNKANHFFFLLPFVFTIWT